MNLTQEEQNELAEIYWPLIRKVSRQVASEDFRSWGIFLPGEELANEVFAGLAERGEDLGDVENPQAYIRTDARQKSKAMRRRLQGRKNLAWRNKLGKLDPEDEGASEVIEETVWNEADDVSGFASPGIEFSPERTIVFEEKVSECEAVIAGILQKVPEGARRDAVRAFYLDGATSTFVGSSSARKNKTVGEKGLLPEDLASLQVWRAWLYPELRNRTPETEATPLLAALLS